MQHHRYVRPDVASCEQVRSKLYHLGYTAPGAAAALRLGFRVRSQWRVEEAVEISHAV